MGDNDGIVAIRKSGLHVWLILKHVQATPIAGKAGFQLFCCQNRAPSALVSSVRAQKSSPARASAVWQRR